MVLRLTQLEIRFGGHCSWNFPLGVWKFRLWSTNGTHHLFPLVQFGGSSNGVCCSHCAFDHPPFLLSHYLSHNGPTTCSFSYVPCKGFLRPANALRMIAFCPPLNAYTQTHTDLWELHITVKCALPLGYCLRIVCGLCEWWTFVPAGRESACLLWLNGSSWKNEPCPCLWKNVTVPVAVLSPRLSVVSGVWTLK